MSVIFYFFMNLIAFSYLNNIMDTSFIVIKVNRIDFFLIINNQTISSDINNCKLSSYKMTFLLDSFTVKGQQHYMTK